MNPLPGEQPQTPDQPDISTGPAKFTSLTAEMKRKNRITGLLFLGIVMIFVSISVWRRFFP